MSYKNTLSLSETPTLKPYLIILAILMLFHAHGQGFKMNYSNSFADCFGAVEVTEYSNPSYVQFPGNFGFRDDFVGFDPDFHEVNSVWLRLEPNLKGLFEFEISTENNVDFSYFLFRSTSNSFCEELENDHAKPLLFQSSSYHTKGAMDSGGDFFKGSVECVTTDVFYLMIHTNSTYKGHVTVKYNRIGEIKKTASIIQDYRADPNGNYLRIKIRDKESGEPVLANMTILGVKKDNYLFMGTDFFFDASTARQIEIESNTQGYFLFFKGFSTKGTVKQNIEILLELERLGPGKKLALENIKFEEDSDEFLSISLPALKRLLDFMAVNDKIKVEIQGHVNAPGYKNTSKIKSLSESRAKAVKDFLKDNGIEPDRMEVVGYGNTQMIFEKPSNAVEEEANRRVEIKIIEA